MYSYTTITWLKIEARRKKIVSLLGSSSELVRFVGYRVEGRVFVYFWLWLGRGRGQGEGCLFGWAQGTSLHVVGAVQCGKSSVLH